MEHGQGSAADAEAVARALNGQRDAFDQLVRRYLTVVHAVAFAVLGDSRDADDALQDAFLIAWQRLRECREPARFKSWLLRITRNRAYNIAQYNRVRRHEPLDIGMRSRQHDPAESRELHDALSAALTQLKPVLREVLLLHDLEGLPHAEIAGLIDSSELMSRKHLMNARKQMRELLSRYGDQS
jgi:RNA polymerase sigma-70 factor (ECF subfamily)